MLEADEDGWKSEVASLLVRRDEDGGFMQRAGGAVRNDPVSGLIKFVVEGITVGGGIDMDARYPGRMTSVLLLGALEPLRSAATDDCREVLPVVDRPLGFATGLNTGPPFSVNLSEREH